MEAMPSRLAASGGARIVSSLVGAARAAGHTFIEGPTWNHSDRLIARDTQWLHYTLPGLSPREVVFLTTELEKYGAQDQRIIQEVDEKINLLLS